MSQESDGSTDPHGGKIDQLIQGLPDAELAGALLLEEQILTPLSLNEDATERESASAPEDIQPSGDEQVSSEANEPVLNSSAPTTRQDALDRTALSSAATPPKLTARRTKKGPPVPRIVFAQEETPQPQAAQFPGVARDKVEFKMAGRLVTVTVDDLKRGLYLGEGTFGTVKRVKLNGDSNLAVAVKCLLVPDKDEEKYKKICKEQTMLQTVAQNRRCRHIVIYHDALLNTDFGELCFIMELMDTNLQSAYEKLHQMKPFDKHKLDVLLRRVAYNVVSALKFMSGHGLSHNDVKPLNILLNRHGDLVLVDFGESNDINDGTVSHTHRPGTPYYWPPEYTLKDPMCSSERSNLYALGMTLVEICLGCHPYPLKMEGIQLDSHIQSWKPSVPLDKVSEEAAKFIHDLLQERHESPFTVYSDILKSAYLQNMTSEPSQEEIDLFRSLVS